MLADFKNAAKIQQNPLFRTFLETQFNLFSLTFCRTSSLTFFSKNKSTATKKMIFLHLCFSPGSEKIL